MKKLLSDYKQSAFKIKAVWVLSWYRLSNGIYYTKIPSIVKNTILKILKVFQLFFVEIHFST